MAYLNELFRLIINEIPNPGVTEWVDDYYAFAYDIKTMRSRILVNEAIDITDPTLYDGLVTYSDYSTFVTILLYAKYNGVSSRGQSVLSGVNLEKAKADTSLRDLLKQVIINPNSENYIKFGNWWHALTGINNPVLINRAFAACSPENLTSTVDHPKFWKIIHFLASECDFKFPDVGKNWIDYNQMVTHWLDNELKDELTFYADPLLRVCWRNVFFWLLFYYDPSKFEFKKQIVKYGAPGTGKTYTCKKDVENHFAIWKNRYHKNYPDALQDQSDIVQLHPAFTYEDFLEGIRPITKDGKVELRLTDGIFKRFCRKAAAWEFDLYRQLPEFKQKEWSNILVSDVLERLTGDQWDFLREIKNPGTTALDKVIPPYYFIIDEINRAELSRVFGELMYCLEYRGYEGKIKTQYSSMVETENAETSYWFENGQNYFFIPNNVYILGTMNNIDRSVESFDFALRRRFQWIEVEPNYDLIINDNLPENLEPMVASLKKLNDKISKDPLLGKDYRIGHAYFMRRPASVDKYNLKDCKQHFWDLSIKPLLEEYLRGSGEDSRMKEFENILIPE